VFWTSNNKNYHPMRIPRERVLRSRTVVVTVTLFRFGRTDVNRRARWVLLHKRVCRTVPGSLEISKACTHTGVDLVGRASRGGENSETVRTVTETDVGGRSGPREKWPHVTMSTTIVSSEACLRHGCPQMKLVRLPGREGRGSTNIDDSESVSSARAFSGALDETSRWIAQRESRLVTLKAVIVFNCRN